MGDAGDGGALKVTGGDTSGVWVLWSGSISAGSLPHWVSLKGRLEEDDSFVMGKGLGLIRASLGSHLSLPSSAQGAW